MPGKARVHELAKELGITSKDVLAKLKEQGEFVKSASSTVEAPVARRLRDAYAPKGAKKPTPGPSARPDVAPRAALGDKGYDAKANREAAHQRGICPAIP